MGQFRRKFLRDVWELIGRTRGASVLERLSAALPERLSQVVLIHGSQDAVSLDEAEEFFGVLDGLLGERVLEHLFEELAARALAQNSTLVVGYDLLGTVQRLRGWLGGPFVGVEPVMDLIKSPQGFGWLLGVNARPRATRLLGKMATGAVLAAERFAMESSGSLVATAHSVGDRCRVEVTYSSVRGPSEVLAPPQALRDNRPHSSRPVQFGQLSAEVEQILASARLADSRVSQWNIEPEARRKASRHSPSGMMKSVDISDPQSSPTAARPAGTRSVTPPAFARAAATRSLTPPAIESMAPPTTGDDAYPSGIYSTEQDPKKERPLHASKPTSKSGLWVAVSPVNPKAGKDGG